MTTTTTTPSLADAMKRGISAQTALFHTAFKAVVRSYDKDTQIVTVQPIVRQRRWNPDTELYETYVAPVLANVPVMFPSATGFSMTFPITPGDQGTVICSERSIDEWFSTGEDDCDPQDPRRFDINDGEFYPGGRARPNAIGATGVDATDMVIEGNMKLGDSTATEYVALATKVNAELTSISTDLLAIGGSYVPTPGGVGATKVKAK